MTPVIEAEGVGFAYDDVPILDGLDLTVAAGELVALIGPNGAGKTTCLHVLLGLERHRQGSVRICGEDVRALDRRAIARRVALVPQSPSSDFAFSVREVVAMGRTPYLGRFAVEGQEDRRAIDGALEATGIVHLSGRMVNELSGGERQRVHVARALCQETPVLLLDEPISNLDVEHQLQLLELVAGLTREGKAVVVALHDLSMAARFADRVMILAERRIVASGSPRDVITVENLSRYFHIVAQVAELGDAGHPVVVPVSPTAGRTSER